MERTQQELVRQIGEYIARRIEEEFPERAWLLGGDPLDRIACSVAVCIIKQATAELVDALQQNQEATDGA